MVESALVSESTNPASEPEALDSLNTRRSSHLGEWNAGGGAASILLLVCITVAAAWIVMEVVPRFTSAPLSLPAQRTLWDPYGKPKITTGAAGVPAELGVLFRPTVDGSIVGLRFYKVAGDDGPHVGSLWTPKGKRLATVTFVNETDAGWQEAFFATPVPVSATRLLVASYFAPVDGPMFVRAPPPESDMVATPDPPVFQRPPLKEGSNSVYHLGGPGFPSIDAGASAVWVDVVFVPTRPDP